MGPESIERHYPPPSDLRVLIVEASAAAADLLLQELRRSGFTVTWLRVDSEDGLDAALRAETWQVVLSDYVFPGFNAPAALSLLKQKSIDLPFIIVSGTQGEEAAVASLQAGATDYLGKWRLERLGSAVQRALHETTIRTDAKRMADQLLIRDRMASVGTMAAGVAHEMNNPLAAAIAALSCAEEELVRGANDAGSPDGASSLLRILEPLRVASAAAERMRRIIRDLGVFSRPDELPSVAVDLSQVCDSSVRIALAQIQPRARFVRAYSEVGSVVGNAGRLGQVVLNLLVNAAQAISGEDPEQEEVRIALTQDGPAVVLLEVRDTGAGIPPDVLPRIFDPFFTTKAANMGTGLGLAICHRIVTELGGTIEACAMLPRGTAFRVRLPVAPRGDPATAVPPVPVRAASTRRCSVLIVDDDALVAGALARLLKGEHDVAVVTGGRAALALIDAGQTFDVLLCDLMNARDEWHGALRRAGAFSPPPRTPHDLCDRRRIHVGRSDILGRGAERPLGKAVRHRRAPDRDRTVGSRRSTSSRGPVGSGPRPHRSPLGYPSGELDRAGSIAGRRVILGRFRGLAREA
jgi:signal transduction histidine kinase